ncbi:MAG TPA: hypothetical protein V6C58_14070 [Allocoleopsis sp.]
MDHPFLEILPRTLEELILHDIQNVPLKLLPKLKKLSMCKVTFLENPRFLCKYLPDSLEYLELKDINTDSVYKIQPNIKNIITYDIDNICIIHSHLTKLRKEMVTLQTGDYIRNRIIPLRKTFLHGISLFRRSTDITDTCSDIISRYYYNKKIKSKLSRYLLDVSIENIYNPYHPNCVILRLFTKNNISL